MWSQLVSINVPLSRAKIRSQASLHALALGCYGGPCACNHGGPRASGDVFVLLSRWNAHWLAFASTQSWHDDKTRRDMITDDFIVRAIGNLFCIQQCPEFHINPLYLIFPTRWHTFALPARPQQSPVSRDDVPLCNLHENKTIQKKYNLG